MYSPIAHSHPIARFGLPTDWSYWERVDRRFLKLCDEVVVLTLDGWRESVGVREEVRLTREMGKRVNYGRKTSIDTHDDVDPVNCG